MDERMSHANRLKMVQRSPDGSEWISTHYMSMKIASTFMSKEEMKEMRLDNFITKRYGYKLGECGFWIV